MKVFHWAHVTAAAGAALVLIGSPTSTAQTSASQAGTGAGQPPATPSGQTTSAKAASPLDHLSRAKTVLDKLDPMTVPDSARSKIVELKQKFSQLDESYRKGGKTTVTQQPGPVNSRVTIKKDPTWSPQVVEVDLVISQLLRPRPGGASGYESGIDQKTADTMTEFRKHLTAFAAAATGTVGATPQKP